MTWGFQTCGPNEAMVVSGDGPVSSPVVLTYFDCGRLLSQEASAGARRENLRLARSPVHSEVTIVIFPNTNNNPFTSIDYQVTPELTYLSLRLSLNTMTLQVNTICVNTAYGVAISVNGIAQV